MKNSTLSCGWCSLSLLSSSSFESAPFGIEQIFALVKKGQCLGFFLFVFSFGGFGISFVTGKPRLKFSGILFQEIFKFHSRYSKFH